jgi:phosphoribosylformylglycinamidine synthase
VDLEQALLVLLGSPNIRSRRSVFRQYDHQVGNSTMQKPGGDAAVLRVAPDGRGIAVTTDGNARYGAIDPYYGGAVAVLEAAQNIVAVGANPLAITNCLNFGNSNKGEVYWQMQQAVAGMGDACRELAIPVVSGNVSLHNETDGVAIDPTVVVGMVGAIDDVSIALTSEFKRQGDVIALIGGTEVSLAGSEYQRLFGGGPDTLPPLVIPAVVKTIRLVMEMVESGWLYSVHDCSEGGLAVAIAECCVQGGLGCDIDLADDPTTLFGEGMARFVVSLAPERFADLAEVAAANGVNCLQIGRVAGATIRIGQLSLHLDAATKQFQEDL